MFSLITAVVLVKNEEKTIEKSLKSLSFCDEVLVIDDGSAKVEVTTEQPAEFGDVVRIIARVLPLETGYDLRAELTQDMSKLDMELYRKVMGNV